MSDPDRLLLDVSKWAYNGLVAENDRLVADKIHLEGALEQLQADLQRKTHAYAESVRKNKALENKLEDERTRGLKVKDKWEVEKEGWKQQLRGKQVKVDSLEVELKDVKSAIQEERAGMTGRMEAMQKAHTEHTRRLEKHFSDELVRITTKVSRFLVEQADEAKERLSNGMGGMATLTNGSEEDKVDDKEQGEERDQRLDDQDEIDPSFDDHPYPTGPPGIGRAISDSSTLPLPELRLPEQQDRSRSSRSASPLDMEPVVERRSGRAAKEKEKKAERGAAAQVGETRMNGPAGREAGEDRSGPAGEQGVAEQVQEVPFGAPLPCLDLITVTETTTTMVTSTTRAIDEEDVKPIPGSWSLEVEIPIASSSSRSPAPAGEASRTADQGVSLDAGSMAGSGKGRKYTARSKLKRKSARKEDGQPSDNDDDDEEGGTIVLQPRTSSPMATTDNAGKGKKRRMDKVVDAGARERSERTGRAAPASNGNTVPTGRQVGSSPTTATARGRRRQGSSSRRNTPVGHPPSLPLPTSSAPSSRPIEEERPTPFISYRPSARLRGSAEEIGESVPGLRGPTRELRSRAGSQAGAAGKRVEELEVKPDVEMDELQVERINTEITDDMGLSGRMTADPFLTNTTTTTTDDSTPHRSSVSKRSRQTPNSNSASAKKRARKRPIDLDGDDDDPLRL